MTLQIMTALKILGLGMGVVLRTNCRMEYTSLALWDDWEEEEVEGFSLPELEPWETSGTCDAFDSFEAAAIFRNSQPKKRDSSDKKKKHPLLECPSASEILCRVARKQSEATIELPDYYMHCKKIIEVEYQGSPIPEPRGLEAIDVENIYPKSASIRPEDISQYFKNLRRKGSKSAGRPCTPRIFPKIPIENKEPIIPFRPKSRSSEPVIIPQNSYDPKFEAHHHPVLTRMNDSSNEVVINNPSSDSLKEWRKQRAAAAESMKKLKCVFPATTVEIRKPPIKKRIVHSYMQNQMEALIVTNDHTKSAASPKTQNIENIATMFHQLSPLHIEFKRNQSNSRNNKRRIELKDTNGLSTMLDSSRHSMKMKSTIGQSSRAIPSLSLSSSIRALSYRF